MPHSSESWNLLLFVDSSFRWNEAVVDAMSCAGRFVRSCLEADWQMYTIGFR
jgi:hypothetical protein